MKWYSETKLASLNGMIVCVLDVLSTWRQGEAREQQTELSDYLHVVLPQPCLCPLSHGPRNGPTYSPHYENKHFKIYIIDFRSTQLGSEPSPANVLVIVTWSYQKDVEQKVKCRTREISSTRCVKEKTNEPIRLKKRMTIFFISVDLQWRSCYPPRQ